MSEDPDEGPDKVEDALWNRRNQFKGPMRKYWNSRYNLFSRYDNGILLTKELWYSVTPELISKFMAKVASYSASGKILDIFCGGGGNTVQLLDCFDQVIGLDNNDVHLKCTLNNATVYYDPAFVTNHLKLIQCDWGAEDDNMTKTLEYLKGERIDLVFGSPPWGGPSYSKHSLYDMDQLEPMPLKELLLSLLPISQRIMLFLPRNSDIDQIERISQQVFSVRNVRVLKLSVYGHLKGLLCCWGLEFDSLDLDDLKLAV